MFKIKHINRFVSANLLVFNEMLQTVDYKKNADGVSFLSEIIFAWFGKVSEFCSVLSGTFFMCCRAAFLMQ